jgi:ubiquinone/menaquinone biosynthesis C-methylase UbiE
VADFPDPEALAERVGRAGFTRVGFERLTCGIAALTWGEVT